MGAVVIRAYQQEWPAAFEEVADALWATLDERPVRIDHIGSTAVPGLDAKDVIDVQVTVADADGLDLVAGILAAAGWTPSAVALRDHPVPGLSSDPPDWEKRFLSEPPGTRRVNLHVRVVGRPNQRYPLLFRDYLRAHPQSASAYATLKRHLAALLPDEPDRYADVKDPACDLIYFAAERWADDVGWNSSA